jgi:type IV secretion system protein TrbL
MAGGTLLSQPPPPAECGTFDLACQAGEAVGSAFDAVVIQIARGAADLVVAASTWWVQTDSINPLDSAVLAAQGATAPVVAAIMVGSILVQAIRMILLRKAEPLITAATGLLRYAIVSALGLTLLQAGLRAGDAFAVQLLDGAANNFAFLMRDILTTEQDSGFAVLLMSLIAAVLGLVQWLMMMLRQAGLLVLAALLTLAATNRKWLNQIIPWVIGIAVYKPAAALIYYIGFSYLSSPSSNNPGGTTTMLTGCMVLLLAVIAMPVLLKFFSWSGTQLNGASGGGSGFLGAAGAVAMSQSYRGSQAVSRAAAMESSGPGTAPAGATPLAGGSAGGATAGGAGGAAGALGGAAAAATVAASAVRGAGAQLTGDAGRPDGGGSP